VHEPSFDEDEFFGSKVLNDVSEFVLQSDLIVANRVSDDLRHVKHKIFTRDIFGEN
jgi:UDPglucose 6-dehydrogenase